jgi:hypothetical protein
MAEMELLPNSHKYKQEQKEASEKRVKAPVVTNGAKTKKKSEISKLGDVFISEDIKNVKSYVLMDVLVPAIKKAISDIVTNGIDMILYGETGRSSKRASTDRFSYSSCYSGSRNDRPSESNRGRFEYDDIIFTSRADAARVQEELANVIDRYGFVTVLDYYDMAEITAPHTANKYGWMSRQSIIHADIIRARDGYIIRLPKAMPID